MTAPSAIFAPDLLDGRVALVTGGGTNLGREAARELLAAGASVVIAGRREDVLADTVAQLGERASWVSGDVREGADRERIVATVLERHGRLDVLLNNAGGQYLVPAEGLSAKGWQAVQRLNVGGTLGMTQAVVDGGFGPDGGTVVNVTVSPHGGMPAMAHTGAARAAVEALGREQAAAWAERGIAVVSLAVGRFDTESLRKYPKLFFEAAASTIPLQRLGSMQEFGWAVTLLASPLGRSFSGQVVTLDGGVDNWDGPWPHAAISEDGTSVPTEARRPAAPAT